jgi:methyl halide transferase
MANIKSAFITARGIQQMTEINPLSAEYWDRRYQEGSAPWNLGWPAPPFVSLMATTESTSGASGSTLSYRPTPGSMAVLGCGHGHDALFFAEQGFEVVGCDFSPLAIAAARSEALARGLAAEFLERDIFSLVPEFGQRFDYVLEHTCFCAIDPTLRPQYVELVSALLRPAGKLLALFFTHDRPGGPPFATTTHEITALFADRFEILSLEPANDSIEKRRGEEHLGILQVLS